VAVQLVGKRFEYTLESDRDSGQPTVWQIMELNARQRRDLASKFIGIAPVAEDATQAEIDATNNEIFMANMSICKAYIVGAAPILDPDGKPVDVPVETVLDSIRTETIIRELALAVIDANKLNDNDKKKSATRPKRKRRG